jgi:hypothetical protein
MAKPKPHTTTPSVSYTRPYPPVEIKQPPIEKLPLPKRKP